LSSEKTTSIGPRDYKVSEIKRHYALSGNECTEPKCFRKLIVEDGHTIVAKICPIEATSKADSRFRQSMDNDERRSYDNLILLCDEHHQMIDNKANESKYAPVFIKRMENESFFK